MPGESRAITGQGCYTHGQLITRPRRFASGLGSFVFTISSLGQVHFFDGLSIDKVDGTLRSKDRTFDVINDRVFRPAFTSAG